MATEATMSTRRLQLALVLAAVKLLAVPMFAESARCLHNGT